MNETRVTSPSTAIRRNVEPSSSKSGPPKESRTGWGDLRGDARNLGGVYAYVGRDTPSKPSLFVFGDHHAPPQPSGSCSFFFFKGKKKQKTTPSCVPSNPLEPLPSPPHPPPSFKSAFPLTSWSALHCSHI